MARQLGLRAHLCLHGLHRGFRETRLTWWPQATTGTGLRDTRRSVAFSNLASEVTRVTSATFCPSEVKEAPPGSWKGDTDVTFCGDRVSEFTDTSPHACFRLLTPGVKGKEYFLPVPRGSSRSPWRPWFQAAPGSCLVPVTAATSPAAVCSQHLL